MEAYDIAWLRTASIFCVWSAIWLGYFILKYKEIRKLLKYKDYTGILALIIIILDVDSAQEYLKDLYENEYLERTLRHSGNRHYYSYRITTKGFKQLD